ncbi:alpha/beta hydrolase family protein [Aliibacillus thermotolerans]|uniref:Alpha/beta hydrolase family protein n=1 Tax=Aliibacillus thermotolerans TaxID=1834418 RepID=A0ABW0U8F1_9BACI|nr:alpha/beta hydrolase [Aliibacillus thermotolerans]
MSEEQSFVLSLEDDLFIRGEVHAPSNREKAPVVIICHGFKGYKDWNFFPYTATTLAKHGFYAIRFNFSMNGVKGDDFDELEKFAENTYSRELNDLHVLMEKMEQRELPYAEFFDLERVGILGHSRGGGDSVLFASESKRIQAVVTWNGISQVDIWGDDFRKQVFTEGVGYVENKRTNIQMPIKRNVFDDIEKNKERFDILGKISNIKVPILIVQGDADLERLVEGAKKMHEKAPHSQLMMIKGAGHTFNASHPLMTIPEELEEALNETTRFFTESLK